MRQWLNPILTAAADLASLRRDTYRSAGTRPARRLLAEFLVSFAVAVLGTGCAGYRVGSLTPGTSRLADVEHNLGAPSQRWIAADGSQRLAYVHGPSGFTTYMVDVGPDGVVQHVENVLEMRGFARVTVGLPMAEVIRLLGPSNPYDTAYFERRDELVLGWRFCDDWNEPSHYYVLFDGRTQTVRSAMAQPESLGYGGDDHPRRICSH